MEEETKKRKKQAEVTGRVTIKEWLPYYVQSTRVTVENNRDALPSKIVDFHHVQEKAEFQCR
jgi:hypothetical protein